MLDMTFIKQWGCKRLRKRVKRGPHFIESGLILHLFLLHTASYTATEIRQYCLHPHVCVLFPFSLLVYKSHTMRRKALLGTFFSHSVEDQINRVDFLCVLLSFSYNDSDLWIMACNCGNHVFLLLTLLHASVKTK